MPRFYCPPPLPASGRFELPSGAAHHAIRVLRLREGAHIHLFDGEGRECLGIITETGGKRVIVDQLTELESERESPLRTVLAQALCSSEKMDWIVQKATELGVTEIQPLDTERSVARLTPERAIKRLEHWQQVAISACEQCGRNRLPLIHSPVEMMVWLRRMQSAPEVRLALLPEGNTTLNHLSPPSAGVALLVGPEGGFSAAECDTILQSGFTPVRLGPRILRTETAAIAGLTAAQIRWGDFNL
ncbi:MAG: 16S rRNA (uracil(1498)-N(3))-methyltransferase [Gallionella sp.]|jgi:16S rRNA (uracil1498-N3)-methyltransferase|nr:16S rRNA (uracil(1498)-N(3))-methyltransferase [Gallionella sp.]